MEKNKKQKTLELDAESGNMKGERQGEVTNKSELSASWSWMDRAFKLIEQRLGHSHHTAQLEEAPSTF